MPQLNLRITSPRRIDFPQTARWCGERVCLPGILVARSYLLLWTVAVDVGGTGGDELVSSYLHSITHDVPSKRRLRPSRHFSSLGGVPCITSCFPNSMFRNPVTGGRRPAIHLRPPKWLSSMPRELEP